MVRKFKAKMKVYILISFELSDVISGKYHPGPPVPISQCNGSRGRAVRLPAYMYGIVD